MSTSKSHQDVPLKEEIMSAVTLLQSAGTTISISAIVQQIVPLIVNSYDNVSLFTYKAIWVKRIASTMHLNNVTFSKSKINFENIFALIHDKSLGIENNLGTQNYNFDTLLNLQVARTPNEASTTTSLSTTASSSSSSKQQKLSDLDKIAIDSTYSNLNESKMWKLSTGKLVEKEMQKFALSCNFEHPCHSLILDTSDKLWEDYFNPAELVEIKTHNVKNFPKLPEDLKRFLQDLFKYSSLTLEELYEKIKAFKTSPITDPTVEWAQSTIIDIIKLYITKYLPLTNHSESDLIRRVWFMVDTVFDSSERIKCRSGEKSSMASSDSRNQDRTIAGIEPMSRKLTGRKLDMVFKSSAYELGIMEGGRSEGLNSTKEISDGSVKMPKVLKDTLVALCSSSPTLTNQLSVPGVILMNLKLTLVTMDSPCGYVCRMNRVNPISFPSQPKEIISHSVEVIKYVYSLRLFMENTLDLLSTVTPSLDDGIEFGATSDTPLPPSFYINNNTSNQKRKAEEIN